MFEEIKTAECYSCLELESSKWDWNGRRVGEVTTRRSGPAGKKEVDDWDIAILNKILK